MIRSNPAYVYLQHVVPFIFVLMSCTEQTCYAHILKYIHDNICSLEGSSFMTDYEAGMRNAIAGQYPNVRLRCCWLHFCQTVKTNASRNACFVDMIRNNSFGREIYYKLLCIPLLPPKMIPTAFEILKKKADRVDHESFHEFLQYYEQQWLIRVCIYFDFRSFAVPI